MIGDGGDRHHGLGVVEMPVQGMVRHRGADEVAHLLEQLAGFRPAAAQPLDTASGRGASCRYPGHDGRPRSGSVRVHIPIVGDGGCGTVAWKVPVMDESPVRGDKAGPFTLLSVFRVAPGSQDSLASSVLSTAADIAARLPGFLDATVLRSVDGQRVVNYAHWTDQAAFEAFMADARTPARLRAATELGEPDGHAYTIAGRVDAPAAGGPLAVYRRMQQLIGEQAWDQLGEAVDVEGYTENCVGLTPHTPVNVPAPAKTRPGRGDRVTDQRLGARKFCR